MNSLQNSMRAALAGILVAALGVVALVAPTSATATTDFIYWGEFGATNNIGRANIDGGGATSSFIAGASNPVAIYLAGDYIYWARWSNGAIGRAKVDGSDLNTTFISGLTGNIDGVTVHENYLYFAAHNGTRIGRANLDGSGVNESFITGLDPVTGIVKAGGGYLYWGSYTKKIGRAKIDGTGVQLDFIPVTTGNPEGLAIDGSYIYWGNPLSGTSDLGRAKLDGTSANNSFLTGLGAGIYGVTLDSTHLYWGASLDASIGKAPLDGSSKNNSLVTGLAGPGGVATTGEHAAANPVPPPNVQAPANGCVTSGTTAKSIPRKGNKQLMKAKCVTNADQQIGVRASARLRGDIVLYKLYCKVSDSKHRKISKNASGAYCKSGAMYIKTYGHKLKLRITWAAPATDAFTAYKKVKNYRT